jgi:hypothetical protein
MKIKIFFLHEDIENYEDEINKFIKNKKVIDIKHSISSYGMANNYTSSEGIKMKHDFSSLALVNANERKVKKEREEKKLRNRIKKIFRKIK